VIKKNASLANTVSWIHLACIFLGKINSIINKINVSDLINGYMKFAFIYSLRAFEKLRKATVIFIMAVRWNN
jgi:hypothetical protein